MTPTLQSVYDAARGYLNDFAVSGGEIFTNSALQQAFGEPYRSLFGRLMGISKRVQKAVYVNFPASTTVLVPSFYGITDFAEPEVIEERLASNLITIVTTSTSSPIVVNAPSHGLGTAGSMVEGVVSGVLGTFSPWGRWFETVIDANNFSLNGSVGDVAGTGGSFSPWTQIAFSEVYPLDLDEQGLDGNPQSVLGNYIWRDERLEFRGCTNAQQLRITYWASGNPPTNPSTSLGIDNCLDFLACATAANAARSLGWQPIADSLRTQAYGTPGTEDAGLLGVFVTIQIATLQRGPQRRRLPFRVRRSNRSNIIYPIGY